MARQKNIIQKEEDLGVLSEATTSSEVIKIDGGQVLSCQVIADVQSGNKTFDSGEAEIDTFTFDTFANTDQGDYLVVYDTTGLAWAAAADKDGEGPEPTGAIWEAIPAGRKVMVDLTDAVTAADVAALFETALNALVAVPFVAADSTADVAVTQDLRGVVEAPEVHNEDDSGAGSITVVITNAGVDCEVDLETSSVSVPAHGYSTGAEIQLTTTGTLPAPLLVATDYYLIVDDADTLRFAADVADALAGTAIELVDDGTDGAVNTIAPVAIAGASVKLQKSNDGVNWTDEGSATNITADASIFLEKVDPAASQYKAVLAISAGSMGIVLNWLVKGIDG